MTTVGGLDQAQFLDTVSREEAIARFGAALQPAPLGRERVALAQCHGRVLASDVQAGVDVPAFDRANVDGFAVRAADTAGASEESPVSLRLNAEVLTPGRRPGCAVRAGTATPLATGAIMPRGADAVLMIEHSDREGDELLAGRSVAPGAFVTHAGYDIALGETVLFGGQPLASREIGLLAAVGVDAVDVWRVPRVAILSTGDELLAPGDPPRTGGVYDSNGAILAAAVREQGGEPWLLGIVPDDAEALSAALERALEAEMVLLSGGTSKGAGDLSYRVVEGLGEPGIVVHGVALRPGKPLCLAVCRQRAVVILPGFPTSAIFTFHEFVAPVLRRLAGWPPARRDRVTATVPVPVPSEYGRVDYRMVGLLPAGDGGLLAYPNPRGSGAVTTFSRADGFIAIEANRSGLPAGSEVTVECLSREREFADLVAIGSHCTGLDLLFGMLRREGFGVRSLHVVSLGGVAAARRGECDIAGMHLLDPATDTYNLPWRSAETVLVPGYLRRQCICFRADDGRFAGLDRGALAARLTEADLTMVNRNAGSGTRVLLDQLLGDRRPEGWGVQPSSHNAVAAAVAQGRADWGMSIEPVARAYGLACLAWRDEHYDFLVPEARLARPAVQRLRALLETPEVVVRLNEAGFCVPAD